MAIKELVAEIDADIALLKEARALLTAGSGSAVKRAQRKKKRIFTPDHRARIAAAQKHRWANQRSKLK